MCAVRALRVSKSPQAMALAERRRCESLAATCVVRLAGLDLFLHLERVLALNLCDRPSSVTS